MEDDNNKQADARRILDAIRQKEESKAEEKPVLQKPLQWLVSEDAAQLQALVEQSRGIKGQIEAEEDLPEPENIDPISVEQIKVMRQSVASTPVHRVSLRRDIYEALIRTYFEIVDSFKTSTRAQRCLIDGHQCVHCGEKFAGVRSPAPNSPESAAQQSTAHPKP